MTDISHANDQLMATKVVAGCIVPKVSRNYAVSVRPNMSNR